MNEGPIREDEIRSYLALLHGSLGGSRAPVSPIKLRELYDRQNYTGMVKLIRDGMKLDLRVRVALVNHGGSHLPPAWVQRPHPFPKREPHLPYPGPPVGERHTQPLMAPLSHAIMQ